jgi:hypothetical protein
MKLPKYITELLLKKRLVPLGRNMWRVYGKKSFVLESAKSAVDQIRAFAARNGVELLVVDFIKSKNLRDSYYILIIKEPLTTALNNHLEEG